MKSTVKTMTGDSLAYRLDKLEYNIISISYLNEDRSKRSPRSILSHFKILVMMSGKASVHMGRNIYYCKKGDCIIFAPGSLYHAEIQGPDRCSFISLNFSTLQPVQARTLKKLLAVKDISIYPSLIPENTMQYLWQVFSAAREDREGSYHSTGLLLRRLVGLMAYSKPVITDIKDKNMTLSREQLVLRCHRHIVNNPDTPVTVADLCGLCNVSQSYMYKCFLSVLGMSTKDFITRTKLEIAARSLLQTNKTILQIAQENGYPNGYRFSAAFKKQYSLSPAAWRKANR